MWPDVTVLIVTFDRAEEIRRTLSALQEHLNYEGPLRWHIADDGSSGSYVQDIIYDHRHLNITATSTQRKGWGANVNKALQSIRSDYIFLIEDDYVAKRPLNLTDGVTVLANNDTLGIVRYDGLAGHVGLALDIKEVPGVPAICYLQIDKGRSSHLNVYSNRPHLRHRRVHDKLGLYPEGHSLGKTETAYAHHIKNNIGQAGVVILADGIQRAFDHIGKSRQGTEHDVYLHRNLQ